MNYHREADFKTLKAIAKLMLLGSLLISISCQSEESSSESSQELNRSVNNLNYERASRQLDFFFTPERLNYFSSTGKWQGKNEWAFTRSLEPLAYCQAAFASGNIKAIAQANLYLENLPDFYQEWYRSNYFLAKYQNLLTDRAKAKIIPHLDEIAEGFMEDHWDFVGTNDNYPCMATCGNILYAERTANKAHLEKGRERLKAFKTQLTRSGVNTEFSSQAYCFIQIEPIAMIAELTKDDEIRKLALEIEERLWIDVLGHYHLPSGKMAGPWSRGYQWDLRGVGLPFSMFDFVLGDLTPFVTLDDYFQASEEWIKVRAASSYGNQYHCPQYLIDWVKNREYPFRFLATADGCASYDDLGMRLLGLDSNTIATGVDYDLEPYGAWNSRIATFMTEKYSMGSSNIPYHSGEQTESFLVTYPRNSDNNKYRNTATIFSRFVVNEEEMLSAETDGYGTTGILFSECGRRLVTQHDNTAVVLYKPKRYRRKNVSSLSVNIYIPNSQWGEGERTIDELFIGEKKLTSFEGVSASFQTVFIKDGSIYMAYIPLVPTNYEFENAVQVSNRNGQTIIEFYNYKGKSKDFTRNEFAMTGNGFVCEVASSDEYDSFEQFRNVISTSKFTDEYRAYQHYRKNPHRFTSYKRDGIVLESEYSPIDEGIRFQTYNGQFLKKPRFEVDGLDESKVPFLSNIATIK